MNSNKHELKVGTFVFGCLALLLLLLLLFSKGFSFTPTFTLKLKAGSAGILKTKAPVQMAGVPVGAISEIMLAPDGKTVTVYLKIQRKYHVHRDARFVIEQSGFLGDQYVSIIPTENKLEEYQDGDEVSAEPPFDLQEVARSAAGFIRRIDDTAKRLNETIDDIRAKALNDQTLTNLANSVVALNKFSEEALGTVDNLNLLVKSNAPDITATISNLSAASATLNHMATELQDRHAAENIALIAANLSITSSNLNKHGLWNVLWKKHETAGDPPATASPQTAGKAKK